MKFVFYSWYNNNAYMIDEFKDPSGDGLIGGDSVSITDQGICFISAHKRWKDEARMHFLSAMHSQLKENFGEGFSAAIAAESDSTWRKEFDPFFEAVKAIDRGIQTVQLRRPCKAGSEKADHFLGDPMCDARILKENFIKIIGAEAQDKMLPGEALKTLQSTLETMYAGVEKDVQSMPVIDKQCAPAPRPF